MQKFNKLFGKQKLNAAWEAVKKTPQLVYPKNAITLLMLNTETGKPGLGWVDKAYKKYPYKKYCPYNFLIRIDLMDTIAKSNPALDMGTVEDFFAGELRKVCIAHIVARVVTDYGMNIEMYVEHLEPATAHLQTFLNDPNRLVTFNCEINEDPKWLAVSGLMNL